MNKNYSVRKKIAHFVFLCFFIPILVLLFVLKQIVGLFSLPMMLYYAPRVVLILGRDIRHWKTIAEIAEEGDMPAEGAREVILVLAEHEYLHYRVRESLLPEEIKEEEKLVLYKELPTKETSIFYEFRLKRNYGGRETHKSADAVLVPT